MNTDFMRWLFDIESIPAGAEGLRFAWERPWPGWLWALLVVVVAVLAFWSYTRLGGSRPGRGVLAGARCLLLLLILVIISGPAIELPRKTVEPDWVLVMLDRSASMSIADAGADDDRRARDEQLEKVLTDHSAMWTELAEQRRLVWLGFHVGSFDLATSEATTGPLVTLGPADGGRTRLSTSLEQALQRTAARPVSGVVVLTDGRTDDPPSRSLLRRLQADAIPVFAVPLGSDDPLGDLAIRRVDAPQKAFIRDKVPVEVELDRIGTVGSGAVVKLIETGTGEELDRFELAADDPRSRVTLTAEPKLAGDATWKVVIETEQVDLIPENNSKPFSIELIDRPLRVLYVDGYPRWEYRYLKNLLVREESIDSSVMLVSADRDFAQEGNQPITRLPRSPEEFAQFDVIILGDVPASFFSPEQLEMIRDHVAERGAGLLWIGGERWTPRTYGGGVLADLLAMRGSLNLPPIGQPVTMSPTPLADRLGVLRLTAHEQIGWPAELSDPAFGWSQLSFAQRIEPGRLKPTAEVLAQTTDELNGAPLPLVVHMRYGAGVTVYVATDEIWRWRYGRGELLPEQFWVQMVRLLGRESLSTAGTQAVLQVSPRRVEVNQPVRVELRLLDAEIAAGLPPTVTALIDPADGRPVVEVELQREGDSEARYVATVLPEMTGELEVRLDDPTLGSLDVRAIVEVFAPDDELRRPETDHALLDALAADTGGRVLQVRPGSDETGIADLPELLPKRSVTTINPLTERLWDTPFAFVLVLFCLTAEWVGRKVLSLV